MGDVNNDLAIREALLLCGEEDRHWLQLCDTSAASSCESYVTTHNFSALHSGTNTNDNDLCCVTKVITTIHCSLLTFNAFITTPQNLQYHEDSVVSNEMIDEKVDMVWMRTIYRHRPLIDVITVHQSKMYHLSEELSLNKPLQLFFNNVISHRRYVGTSTVSNQVRSNSTSSVFPSTVYVYAFHSVDYDQEWSPLFSFSSPQCVRGRVFLSAFVAYETPGPCVKLFFVYAADDTVSRVMGTCEGKIGRVRKLCEMLQQMMTRGTLKVPRKIGLNTVLLCPEPQDPSYQPKYKSCVPGRPTEAQFSVIRPLLTLHNTAKWRPLLAQKGCVVEECEARQCILAPPSLKAYRISTSIECSMATFFCLVGDPLQTHRYDALVDSATVIDVRREGEVVYARYKPLTAHSSPRDYCVLVTSALLQLANDEDQESESSLLPFEDSDMTMMVYLQNATQCNHRPCCEGFERQLMYAFGYIATNTADDTRVQVHHIVCIDSTDNSNHQNETAMVHEYCARMASVRQLCENSRDTVGSNQLSSVNNDTDIDNDNNKQDVEKASFVDIETLEESRLLLSAQNTDSRQSCHDSAGSFEEIEGIVEPEMSDQGESFQSTASVVGSLHASVTKPEQRSTSVRTDPIFRPNKSLENGNEEKRLQTETRVRACSQPTKPPEVSQTPHPENFLEVFLHACRIVTRRNTMKSSVISFVFRTAAAYARTAKVDLTDKMVFHNKRVYFEGPQGDKLEVMAMVRSATGKFKVLGVAIISLRNLQNLVSRTRWVALVGRPGKANARVRCEVCLTLRGGGKNAWKEVVAMAEEEEETLRQRIRQVLVAAGRRDLHRLEWLVGCCCDKLPHEIDALLAHYQRRQRHHNIILTIFDVQGLMTHMGLPLLNSPTCQVWVSTNSVRLRSRVVPLQQVAVFKESFQLTVGFAESICITVVAGGLKVGKVFIAAGLHRLGLRSHTVFFAAGKESAMPSGTVTVAIRDAATYSGNDHHGCPVSFNQLQDESRISSLRLLLSKHLRSNLHKVDVIAASECDMEHYVNTIGACPPQCNLRVLVRRWDPSSAAWDSPAIATTRNEEEGGAIHPLNSCPNTRYNCVYAVIHVGLHYHRTHSVRASESGSAYFDDPVIFHGILPEQDEVLVAIVGKGVAGEDEIDLGVAVFSLKILVRRRTTLLTVPLVCFAGSCDAYLKGSLQVELVAINFSGSAVSSSKIAPFRAQLQRIFYQYDPQHLHRVECLLAEYAGNEEKLVRTLVERYGPNVVPLPLEISLIGIRDFKPACSCYVKVYLNGKTVLRSSQQSGSSYINFQSNDSKNVCTVELNDAQHARLRVKVAHQRYLQSTTVAFAEIRLRHMLAGPVNECWIPLFDNSGDRIGHLGVALRSDAFICRHTQFETSEDVEKDVALLLQKYKPEALPFLQPIITETSSVATAHAEIRRRVAPRPIATTIYICIESLSIQNIYDLRKAQQQETEEAEFTLTAICDHENECVDWPTSILDSGKVIRLDIPDIDKREHHSLTITVQRARGTRSFSHVSKKSRSNSRGRNNNSAHQASQQALSLTEIGRVVLSLRALLTPSLYDKAERVTFPLVSFTQSPTARMTLQQKWLFQQQQQQQQQQQYMHTAALPCSTVVGTVTLSVRLPLYERLPLWMQFNDAKMESHAPLDRAYIRHYEKHISNVLAEHEPQTLLDLHYTLYERDVAHGQWCFSLHNWKRVLFRRFDVIEHTSNSPLLPTRAGAHYNNVVRNNIRKISDTAKRSHKRDEEMTKQKKEGEKSDSRLRSISPSQNNHGFIIRDSAALSF